jgi:hypothetical protein
MRSRFSYPYVRICCRITSSCLNAFRRISFLCRRYPVSDILRNGFDSDKAEKRKRRFHMDHVSHRLEPYVRPHGQVEESLCERDI